MTGEPLSFEGRVVVVSGGGSGIGRSHAGLFAARGASVVVADVKGADDVVSEVIGAGGVATAVTADLAHRSGAESAIETAMDSYGAVDVVVNNAGILRSADCDEVTDELWDEVMAVNLKGAFLLTRAAWPHMKSRSYGRIVFTTSNSGLLGIPGSSAYAASKAALWGLTRVLALEGTDLGIQANAVAPIAFTSMSSQSRAAPPTWRSGEGDAWSARLRPDYVSSVVAWLAHEECDLNGEVLSTAGGRVARFFLGLTPGYVDEDLTIESVAANQPAVIAEDGYEVHRSASQESRSLHRRLMR